MTIFLCKIARSNSFLSEDYCSCKLHLFKGGIRGQKIVFQVQGGVFTMTATKNEVPGSYISFAGTFFFCFVQVTTIVHKSLLE